MALITYLTRIQFDFGALKLLEAELQLLGMRRPLIVTDKGVIAAGLWAKVKDNLPGNMPITIYDGTPENPTEAAMRDALKVYKDEGCDGIIAIGGGSPMDLAKAVALMATHPGNSLQAYSFVEGGAGKITAAVAPVVAIPTTSGTGSEVSRGGVSSWTRPQARDRQPAPDSPAGADRPRADDEPAATSHGRHGDGRLHAQYRMLPVQCLQSAGRRDRARWAGEGLEIRRARDEGRLGPRGALQHGDGRHGRRDGVPEGLGRGACAQPSDRRAQGLPPAPWDAERGLPARRCCASTSRQSATSTSAWRC